MLQLNCQQAIRRLILIAAMAGFAACDPPGPVSLHALDSSVETDGSQLLGAWYGELHGQEVFVHVVEGQDGSPLQIVVIGHDSVKGNWGLASVTPAMVDGANLLSVRQDDSQGRSTDVEDYLIVRFRTSRDKRHVSVYAMDKELIADAIKRHAIDGSTDHGLGVRLGAEPEELVEFIEATGAHALFSVQIGYLERVSEDDIPPIGSASKL